MKKKLKILNIIVQHKLRSGGGLQMYYIAKELSKRGHNITAIYEKKDEFEGDFKVFDNTNINLKRIGLYKFKLDKENFESVMNLRRIIKENKFDVIHTYKGTALDFIILATLGMKIPIVTTRGMMTPLEMFNSLKYKLKKVKKVIAISHAIKDILIKTGKIPSKKIEVIYGAVDTEKFNYKNKSTLREELKIGENDKIIGFVGNESDIKGAKYLIEAFKEVSKRNENNYLVMAGISEKYLEQFKIDENIKKRIKCLGFRKDVENCMSGFDIFVFPGIGEEGLGMTIAEAEAMKKPIIVTKAGATVELVKDGYNGFLIDKKNEKQLIEAIEKLLNDNAMREKFGENSLKFIEENLKVEVIADKIEKLYYSVL